MRNRYAVRWDIVSFTTPSANFNFTVAPIKFGRVAIALQTAIVLICRHSLSDNFATTLANNGSHSIFSLAHIMLIIAYFFLIVKPIALMEYLIKLVLPPGGIVLDPFCGTGSTLIAADRLGARWLGCDTDAGSVATAQKRIEADRKKRIQVSMDL